MKDAALPLIATLLAATVALVTSCSDDTGSPSDASDRDSAADTSTNRDSDVSPVDSGADTSVTADSGSIDSGEDAGSADGCDGSTALFCEDFEALASGEATSDRWNTAVGNGALTIDAAHARGAQALHVHTEENSYGFLRLDFAPPGNSYFGRMYIYVDAFPSAPAWAHYTMVEQRGSGNGERIRPVGGQFVERDDAAYWGIGADGGPTGDWTNWRTSAPSEAGRWVCVEWEMRDADSFVRLTFDGVANEDLTVDRTDHGGNDVDLVFPTFETISIGWQLYQGSPTPSVFDVWIDDIVLDTTRVGC